jgi:hypothetical protein
MYESKNNEKQEKKTTIKSGAWEDRHPGLLVEKREENSLSMKSLANI